MVFSYLFDALVGVDIVEPLKTVVVQDERRRGQRRFLLSML